MAATKTHYIAFSCSRTFFIRNQQFFRIIVYGEVRKFRRKYVNNFKQTSNNITRYTRNCENCLSIEIKPVNRTAAFKKESIIWLNKYFLGVNFISNVQMFVLNLQIGFIQLQFAIHSKCCNIFATISKEFFSKAI